MGAVAGRYKDVSRAPIPGELPPEGAAPTHGRPLGPAGSLTASSDHDRRIRRAELGEAARQMGRSRTAGAAPLIKHGVVDDPNPTLVGRRQRAAVNIKTDALEFEYARDRVTTAGYWAACAYRVVLERSRTPMSGGGAWNPGNKVDQVIGHEIAILGRIARAQDAAAMIRETAPVLGMIGQRVMELVLIDGVTLAEAARRIRGRADRQDVIFYAGLFRECCELLADFWCGRNQRMPRP